MGLESIYYNKYGSKYFLVSFLGINFIMSRDSSVTIVTGYGLEDRSSICSKGKNNFHHCPGSGASSYSNGYRVIFPRIKQPELQAENKPPSNSWLKNVWNVTSNPPHVFMATNNLTFNSIFWHVNRLKIEIVCFISGISTSVILSNRVTPCGTACF